MSVWRRLAEFFGRKTSAALDRLEDPRESLELAYQKQVRALEEARRGVADVLTGEKRLELEAHASVAAGERHAQAARIAVRSGDDSSARRELEREAFVAQQRERLLSEVGELRAQRVALEALTERIRQRVESIRTEKLALGARYAAATAAIRAGETVTGLSDEMSVVAGMVERARSRARDAQARSAALAQLARDERLDGEFPLDAAGIEARLAAIKASQLALPE